jgi:hypothetical protein
MNSTTHTHITHTTPILPMEEARRFLIENPTETKLTAARIFNVNVKTLTASIGRGGYDGQHEGHNKVLNSQKEKALENFIRSLLMHEILSTHNAVFNAICSLKRARNSSSSIRR